MDPDTDGLEMLHAYDFSLPESCVSQQPAPSREAARLMVIDRDTGRVVESGPSHRVGALPDWLRAGDLLVVNVTRVLPARLVGRKASGGSAEALLLGRETAPGAGREDYRALVKCGGRLRVGIEFDFGEARWASRPDPATSTEASPRRGALPAMLTALHDRGEVSLRFEAGADPYASGRAPLPPYIKRGRAEDDATEGAQDLERYQTVYASAPGAIAAPTAGLHLTRALLDRLRAKGVQIAEVVLHVGAGTFRPLDREAFEQDRLHAERFELPEATEAAIRCTRERGGRVVAVGTTTTRVLESRADGAGGVRAGCGETELFIRPGGRSFQVVDALLTNFHLPRSSLLLLVAAFVGCEALLEAYAKAIAEGFRFYSYGDAMLILRAAEAQRDG
jgi:S-adenosylmethionine:tRNA ribosyltransferase-isomerase